MMSDPSLGLRQHVSCVLLRSIVLLRMNQQRKGSEGLQDYSTWSFRTGLCKSYELIMLY